MCQARISSEQPTASGERAAERRDRGAQAVGCDQQRAQHERHRRRRMPARPRGGPDATASRRGLGMSEQRLEQFGDAAARRSPPPRPRAPPAGAGASARRRRSPAPTRRKAADRAGASSAVGERSTRGSSSWVKSLSSTASRRWIARHELRERPRDGHRERAQQRGPQRPGDAQAQAPPQAWSRG